MSEVERCVTGNFCDELRGARLGAIETEPDERGAVSGLLAH